MLDLHDQWDDYTATTEIISELVRKEMFANVVLVKVN
jgi:hypothetical protein